MQCSSINFRKCWWKFAGLEISVIVQRSIRCYLMHEIKSNCITLRLLVSVTSFWRNLESYHDIVWESHYCSRTKNSTISPLITQAVSPTLSVGRLKCQEARSPFITSRVRSECACAMLFFARRNRLLVRGRAQEKDALSHPIISSAWCWRQHCDQYPESS